MTAYRFVTLTCDGCGEVYDDGRSLSALSVRSNARREAWTNPGRNVDHCPACSGTHKRVGDHGFVPITHVPES